MKLNQAKTTILIKALQQYRDRKISLKQDPSTVQELLKDVQKHQDAAATQEYEEHQTRVIEEEPQIHPLTGQRIDEQ